jgi:hypothetical protein
VPPLYSAVREEEGMSKMLPGMMLMMAVGSGQKARGRAAVAWPLFRAMTCTSSILTANIIFSFKNSGSAGRLVIKLK